jgi:hypothetical protein
MFAVAGKSMSTGVAAFPPRLPDQLDLFDKSCIGNQPSKVSKTSSFSQSISQKPAAFLHSLAE